MKKAIILLLMVGILLSAPRAGAEQVTDPPFPAWVFGHVVWEDESTTQGVYDLVKGYQDHRIPVDAVIIDSPWETAYNTFEVDTKRYPDFRKLIADLHAQNIKVVMWVTSMVNTEDPEYQTARDRGYFVKGMEARSWWKGVGGLVDYNNPAAVKWWHERMNQALDLGIDGWKVDGTDPIMLYKGWGARQQYATQYYSDFYDYSRAHTGRKMVIMARPMEQGVNESALKLPGWTNPFGLGVWLRFAPKDRSFMAWVGDQDPSFDGFTIARRHVLRSAKENYLAVGSDIGGYRFGGPSKEVLLRWEQFGAFCPLMENGGIGEHRPWKFDAETVSIYRAYVLLHEALRPYLYSAAVENWQKKISMITPVVGGKDEYLLGRDLLIAPVTTAGGQVRVVLPGGEDWMPLFARGEFLKNAAQCLIPGSQPALLRGGCAFTHGYGLAEFPIFIRAGAAIPLSTAPGADLFGDFQCAQKHRRLLLAAPRAGVGKMQVNLTVYEEGQAPVALSGEVSLAKGDHRALEAGGEMWPVFVPGQNFPAIPQ